MSELILPEEWRDISRCPGYQISDLGRGRSCWQGRTRVGMTASWHILKPIINSHSGYATFNLRRDGKAWKTYIHRLVLEAFVGPCPEGMEARHFPDRDRTNCRLTNLSWASHATNIGDKKLHGTQPVGESSRFAKLTESQVIEIRERRISEESYQKIAKRLGMSHSAIVLICLGERWSHVRPDLIEKCRAISVDNSLASRGENNASAKLTEAQVLDIKSALREGVSRQTIAADYNVTVSAINLIATGRSWSHL
jgi:hypothetical protein